MLNVGGQRFECHKTTLTNATGSMLAARFNGNMKAGDKTSIGVEDGNAVISTEIGGTRVDLRLPIGDRQTPSGQGPTPTPATPPAQPQPAPAPPP